MLCSAGRISAKNLLMDGISFDGLSSQSLESSSVPEFVDDVACYKQQVVEGSVENEIIKSSQ